MCLCVYIYIYIYLYLIYIYIKIYPIEYSLLFKPRNLPFSLARSLSLSPTLSLPLFLSVPLSRWPLARAANIYICRYNMY